MTNEELVWSDSPSQVLNLPTFIVCGLLFWLVIPIFIAVWKRLVLKNTRYELTTERLRVRRGVLNKELEELELYRVRDYRLDQPFILRMFSLGNITITTTDVTQPMVILRGIRQSEQVREQVRNHVEQCRTAKRVRTLDME